METIRKIKPGEINVGEPLPWPVYDIEKALLLQEGTVVRSEKQMNIIMEKGVYRGMTADEVVEEKKKEQIKLDQRCSNQPSNPFEMKRSCAEKLQGLIHDLIAGDKVDAYTTAMDIAKTIKHSCEYNANATLAAIHLSDEFSYGILHPLHAATLSELLMRRLNFTDAQEQTVMAAALLMNVGMFELQDELFAQTEALTEQQKAGIHAHPQKSVDILKAVGVKDTHLLKIILQHHERIDSDGYPGKLSGDIIHQGAKVVALADMYAAMITPRAYREPIMAHDAMKKIFVDRGKSVDDHLTQLLIREVGVYPPGSFVKLVSGDTAIVVKRAIVKKGSSATTPVVACIISPRGGLYEKPLVRDTNIDMYKITSMAQPEIEEPISFAKFWGFK
jgi:HD-GYP domain-containing protein (c-di-GMP phosphodiesterase class II)